MRWPRKEYSGDHTDPHIVRYVLFRCLAFQVVLHHWRKSDEQIGHDHMWDNCTVVLWGRAIEWQDCFPETAPGEIMHWDRCMFPGVVRRRKAEERHYIELLTPTMWTLYITGRVRRDWGYWIKGEFVPWRRRIHRATKSSARSARRSSPE